MSKSEQFETLKSNGDTKLKDFMKKASVLDKEEIPFVRLEGLKKFKQARKITMCIVDGAVKVRIYMGEMEKYDTSLPCNCTCSEMYTKLEKLLKSYE